MAISVQVMNRPDLQWTSGAPVPVIMATERRTLFAFETPAGDARIAEFVGCSSVRFGFPNDDLQGDHPVWGTGIGPYGVSEVHESPWLEEVRLLERRHPQSPEQPFADSHHFVLCFHDSTLEAIAEAIEVVGSAGTADEAVVAMAQLVLPI